MFAHGHEILPAEQHIPFPAELGCERRPAYVAQYQDALVLEIVRR